MRSKEAEERRNQILDVANELFKQKGFDHTSISDILKEVGIARGTLYYHFSSKEEIMDSLIDRYSSMMLERARSLAKDKSIPVIERFFLTLHSLNLSHEDDAGMLDFIHRPQNALMNEKNQRIILQEIPPILLSIVEDGIEEGIFHMDYPYEVVEMMVMYVCGAFGHEFTLLSPELQRQKTFAFLNILEDLFGAEEGSFLQAAQFILGES